MNDGQGFSRHLQDIYLTWATEELFLHTPLPPLANIVRPILHNDRERDFPGPLVGCPGQE
jgi:hypothetical protein